MYFYTVKKIGDGTESNPFRPDYNGDFVWNSDSVCPTCNNFIIATKESVELDEVTNLEEACQNRGINSKDVTKWFVGD